jgi:integrase
LGAASFRYEGRHHTGIGEASSGISKHGRVEAFLQANHVLLTTTQRATFLDVIEPEFHATMRLLGPDRRLERIPTWEPKAAPKDTAQVTLKSILDDWWKEDRAAGRKPATHGGYSASTTALIAFLRHGDARGITPDEIVRFKNHRLSTVSPRTGKPVSAKTVKDGGLSSDGDHHQVGHAKLRGKNFTKEEARAVLSAALRHERGRESPRTFAAKPWVPWLQAYTGAQVGELAQLKKQDVTREGGHWTILLISRPRPERSRPMKPAPSSFTPIWSSLASLRS